MDKLKGYMKSVTQKKYLPFWVFAVVMGIYHVIMREPEGSDAMWFFRNQLDTYTLTDYLNMRYDTWSSRLLIEAVLVYISRNILAWKLLDFVFWMFLAWALVWIFPEEKRETASCFIVGILLLYPMWDLRTAGWIATSVNYSWPLALGVFSLHGTARTFRGQKTSVYMWILYSLAALYAANMEQMAAVLFGINFCAAVCFALEKRPWKQYAGTLGVTAIAAAELIFIFTCPGNGARKEQEIINWMPNFGSYHLLDKVSMGFVDTMHHLIASGNLIYLCYTGCLAWIVCLKTKDVRIRFAAAVPVGMNLWFVAGSDMMERYFPGFFKLMEKNAFICGSNYHLAANYIPTVLYLLLAGCMLVSFVTVCESYFELFGQGILLALGLASRIVMGFTPTIYVSQERTFFYLYIIFGISGAFFLQQNFSLLKKHPRLYEALKLSAVFLVFIGVAANLAEIGSV